MNLPDPIRHPHLHLTHMAVVMSQQRSRQGHVTEPYIHSPLAIAGPNGGYNSNTGASGGCSSL